MTAIPDRATKVAPERRDPLTLSAMGDTLDADITDHLFWCRDIRNLAQNTIRIRRGVLHRAGEVMGVPLRHARIGHVQRWEQAILPAIQPESKAAYIGHLRGFYRWALRQAIISEDPTVLLERPKIGKGVPHPIAEDDLARALREARTPKLRAMIVLTAYAGLRVSEVADVHWSDLRQSGSGWALLVRGKGRRERVVPIGEVVVRALRAHGWARRGPVFLGRDGAQISSNAVSQAINDHYARLGIRATAHYGRHRYLTVGIEDTGDAVLMQQLAGHESLATTQIYTAWSRRKAEDFLRALDARAGIQDTP